MNDKNTRLRFAISSSAADFLESEQTGSVADTIEAIIIERDALLCELLNLNATADQLGIDQKPLMELSHTVVESKCEFVTNCTVKQSVFIRERLKGYASQSIGIECLMHHTQYLRQAIEDFRLECARAVLERRIKSRNTFHRPFKAGNVVAC